MGLVSKIIRIPNERVAMGIESSQDTNKQNSINNAILDIITSLQDSGLLLVPFNGELDLNNIPDINIPNIRSKNDLNGGVFISIGYKYFAFTDTMQNDYPIMLKFDFGVVNASTTGVNSVWFAIKLTTYFNNIELMTTILANVMASEQNDNGNYQLNDTIRLFNSNIVVSYMDNSLYVRIYERTSYGRMYYGNDMTGDTNVLPYISFYIDRYFDGIRFIKLCRGLVYFSGNTITPSPVTYISKKINTTNATTYDNPSDVLLPYYPDYIIRYSINDTMTIPTFRQPVINITSNSIYTSDNLLLTYSNNILEDETFVIDGKKYIAYPQKGKSLGYLTTPDMGMLFRYE